MKNKIYSMKYAYIISAVVIVAMLLLQFVLLRVNYAREAKSTTTAHLNQVEAIIEKNKAQEESLMSSLKDDYIILAKAVSYYLDHNKTAIFSISELQKLCVLMAIDEIHIFDAKGRIFSSSVPSYIGYSFESGDQIAYFKPMLEDKALSMCQDITPNTADSKPMMYAITWSEHKNRMVQIGVEPVRLLSELSANELQSTINNLSLDKNMSVIVADNTTYEILGTTEISYLNHNLSEISGIDPSSINKPTFTDRFSLNGSPELYYCAMDRSEHYFICVLYSHTQFADRTVKALLAVLIYLILASLVITFIIKRLLSSRKQNYEHMQVFQSMSEIYYSLHLADLRANTAVEYTSRNQVKETFSNNKTAKADEMMVKIMHATMSDEYLERGLEFSDISTLAERMKDKKIISMELLGKNVGWIRMSFITITAHKGIPEKIIVATQIIDEEKKLAASLYEKSHIDELTNCYNRRAYNNDILTFMDSDGSDYAYVSLDLNGLKTVNDTLGHEAGDELILGSVECMHKAFTDHGKIYRVGGDEFVALLFVDEDLMKQLCEDFDKRLSEWHGEHVKSLTVSYGYVLSSETAGKTMEEIAEMADKRMYAAKAKYYQEHHIERRRT